MKRIIVAVLCVLFMCTIAAGDWNEEETAKWIQRPDLKDGGYDFHAMGPHLGGCGGFFDDFECNETGPITFLHLWGAWQDGILPEDEFGTAGPDNVEFTVGFYTVDASGFPVANLWEQTLQKDQFTVRPYEVVTSGEFWPYNGWDDPNGRIIWQYNLNLEIPGVEPFIQRGNPDKPERYLLYVYAEEEPYPQDAKIGLRARDPCDGHYNNDARYRTDAFLPPWPDCDGWMTLPGELAFVLVSKPGKLGLKWSQPPIETDTLLLTPLYCGWDEQSFMPYPEDLWKVVADDFHCIGTMPVTTVYWWGSYYGWNGEPEQQPTQPIGWNIGFWSNVPADPGGIPFSHPGEMLWKIDVEPTRVISRQVGIDNFTGHPPDICFKHSLKLEEDEYFKQSEYLDKTKDDIFWLSVVAQYEHSEPTYPWGWKTRPWHWMDDAVSAFTEKPLDIGVILEPSQTTPIETSMGSFDAAFALGTEAEYIKWEQPFNGIRTWEHYEDVSSWAKQDSDGNLDPQPLIQVCDDWICRKRTPVTAIVWWGSYIGYRYRACKDLPEPGTLRPDYFLLQVRRAQPVGTSTIPAEVIWEHKAYDFDEVLVGFDKHPLEDPHEPVFRYSVKLPENMRFHQRQVEDVYWLSIVAVYDNRDPDFEWGWTNHQHEYGSYAVRGWWKDQENWDWTKLYDQTSRGEDMSFVLFTDPEQCSTCPDYDSSGMVNSLDMKSFAYEWLWMGPAGGYNLADLDCDGDTDFHDYAVLALWWLDSCP